MDIQIRETGNIVELEYRVNGIDIARDFVGNNSIVETDDDGQVIMGQDDYDWWVERIAAEIEIEAVIADHIERYGHDAVEHALDHVYSEFADWPRDASFALRQTFNKEETMNCYSVLIDPRHEAQLVPVQRLDSEAVIEFVDTMADGSELWHVTTDHDVDALLNQQPGVISYEVGDTDNPQYRQHVDK